ncbi:hypothetical protein G9A89_009759 [Geosiphon pyriformis]|nr:hypothetical protein G9A89_009759 [Geosiphon pyriformis]
MHTKNQRENLLADKLNPLSNTPNATKYYERFFQLKPNFKRRNTIFQHDNQQELLISSGGGFEKKRKVPLPKTLVKEYRILQLFKDMAYMVNELYCTRENSDIIGRGFIGTIIPRPEVIKSQMEKTKFTLFNLIPEISTIKIDSYWWRSWPDNCFKLFDGRIKRALRILGETNPNKPINIILTGHGIGGFYAEIYGLLLTADPKYNRNVFLTIITFGSPRPGNSQLAAEVQKRLKIGLRVYRITHANDFLPHFPKKSINGESYMHAGTEYWIPGRDCNCEDPDADRILLEGYDIIYECPGFSPQDKQKYGENPGCNLGTDGGGTTAHFGPYFGETFGSCEG